MKKLILIFLASQIMYAQSNEVLNPNTKKINSLDANKLEYNSKEHSIITALVNKNWNGTGMLMGKKATFTMNWQNVLNNQFIKLDFQNKRNMGDNKDIVFSATAFYKIVKETLVVGYWFDNRGVSFPLEGSIKKNELTILWGNNETEMGKTIYRYTSDNEITVEDFILINGKYTKFGYATYKTKD